MALYVCYDPALFLSDELPEPYLKNRIEKFIHALHTEQSLLLLDWYSNLACKKRFDEMRLVGWLYALDEDVLIVFSHWFRRAGREYEGFLQAINSGDGHSQYEKPSRESAFFRCAKEWYELEKAKQTVTPLPKLSEAELLYLQMTDLPAPSLNRVYETAEWVGNIKSLFLDAVEALASLDEMAAALANLDCAQQQHDSLHVRDLFIEYMCRPALDGEGTELLLIQITRERQWTEQFGIDWEWRPLVKRAYNREVLTEDGASRWVRLQCNPSSALSFSIEQMDMLRQTFMQEDNTQQARLPLFINGGAGTGKTTILYFLYQHYLKLYLDNKEVYPDMPPPIYLSSSGQLIEQARNQLTQIMREQSGEDDLELPRDVFSEFRGFLRSLLTDDERLNLFPEGKRISYARFKNQYVRSYPLKDRQEVTPDLAWHIIRTFIKGYNYDLESAHSKQRHIFLGVDEYAELPKSWQLVSVEQYKQIYDSVFMNFYHNQFPSLSKFWDDQDLVHYVLMKDRLQERNAQFGVVFADEVQDFTNLEFMLLLRMTPYFTRDIRPEQLRHLPLVFVGDPYQTLQPTGFDWDKLRARYYQQFLRALNPADNDKVETIRLVTLEHNYRSAPDIVRLGNTVQTLRTKWLQDKHVKAQKPWKTNGIHKPMLYSAQELDAKHALWDSGLELIVPIDDYEMDRNGTLINSLIHYIDVDDVLKEAYDTTESTQVVRNAWNPVQAKGLEFDSVIVYGFGQYYLNHQEEWESLQESDVRFQKSKEYFISKLYVGVTRAQERVVIVDTEEGLRQFWQNREIFKASGTDYLELERGEPSDLQFGEVNYAEQGYKFKKDAEKQEDREQKSRLFQRAAMSFQKAKQTAAANQMLTDTYAQEEQYCRAMSAYHHAYNTDYRKDWIEAAVKLATAGEWERAAAIRWQLGQYAEMNELQPNLRADSVMDSMVQLAQLFQWDFKKRAELKNIPGMNELPRVLERFYDAYRGSWSLPLKSVQLLLDHVFSLDVKREPAAWLDALAEAVAKLTQIQESFHDVVGCYHWIRADVSAAIEEWQKFKSGPFRRAHYASASNELLLERYLIQRKKIFTSEEKRTLCELLYNREKYEELIQFLVDTKDVDSEREWIAGESFPLEWKRWLIKGHLSRLLQEDGGARAFWLSDRPEMMDRTQFAKYRESVASYLEFTLPDRQTSERRITFAEQFSVQEMLAMWRRFPRMRAGRVSFEETLLDELNTHRIGLEESSDLHPIRKALEEARQHRILAKAFEFLYMTPLARKYPSLDALQSARGTVEEYTNLLRQTRLEEWYRFCLRQMVEHLRSVRETMWDLYHGFAEEKRFALDGELQPWLERFKRKLIRDYPEMTELQGAYGHFRVLDWFERQDERLKEVENVLNPLRNIIFKGNDQLISDSIQRATDILYQETDADTLYGMAQSCRQAVDKDDTWQPISLKKKVLGDLKKLMEKLRERNTLIGQFSLMQTDVKRLVDFRYLQAENKFQLVEEKLEPLIAQMLEDEKLFDTTPVVT